MKSSEPSTFTHSGLTSSYASIHSRTKPCVIHTFSLCLMHNTPGLFIKHRIFFFPIKNAWCSTQWHFVNSQRSTLWPHIPVCVWREMQNLNWTRHMLINVEWKVPAWLEILMTWDHPGEFSIVMISLLILFYFVSSQRVRESGALIKFKVQEKYEIPRLHTLFFFFSVSTHTVATPWTVWRLTHASSVLSHVKPANCIFTTCCSCCITGMFNTLRVFSTLFRTYKLTDSYDWSIMSNNIKTVHAFGLSHIL